MYFRKFPKIEYDVKGDGVMRTMTDITRRARLKQSTLLNRVNFDFYDIPDGETPESLAAKYYNDPNLHWVILLANDIKDVYADWPMSVERFETFVKSKYTDINGIHHYEVSQTSGDTTFKIEYPNESATTLPTGAVAVTNYEYEEAELEKKRRIRLVRPEFVSELRTEFQSVIGG